MAVSANRPHGKRERPARRARIALGKIPPTIALCLAIFAALVAVALLAPVISPHAPTEQNLLARLQPPAFLGGGESHLFGTDHLGRDVFSRVLYALRTSLLIALVGTLIGVSFGTLLGLVSGILGGFVGSLTMFLVDVQLAVPFILLVLIAIAVFGTNPVVYTVLIGLNGWETYVRITRGQVLATRHLDYVEAARALGASSPRLALQHVLPNVMTPVIVLATFNFASIILIESALSFLGLGVQPPNVSLGLLISEGREYLVSAWWMAIFPSLVLVLITLTVCLLGDWLRDLLDPRIQR